MSIKMAVFQHTPWEGPGSFLLKAARRHRVCLEVIQVWQQPIPTLDDYDGLIVLGGSPNVSQEDMYPYLRREKEVIRESVGAGRPYLGFCLGLQLLADSLGARVGNNFKASIGFTQGYLTTEGRQHPVFLGTERQLPLFKWHGQTVLPPVPKELSILVTSSECQIEALAMTEQPAILGLQYDNHAADIDEILVYIQKDQKWLSTLTGQEIDPRKIVADAEIYRTTIEQQFESFFANYLQLL